MLMHRKYIVQYTVQLYNLRVGSRSTRVRVSE